MSDYSEAPKARMATCLTDIMVSDLSFDSQECSICQLSLLASSKAGEISCTGPPTRLICGHIFGKACILEWLVDNPTCPFCRLNFEGVVWRNERTGLIKDLEETIQLHDQTHTVGRGARRLHDFILRVTTVEGMPSEPICMTIRKLSREPASMTNDHLCDIVEWWQEMIRKERFSEAMLWELRILLRTLMNDVEIYIHESPDEIAHS